MKYLQLHKNKFFICTVMCCAAVFGLTACTHRSSDEISSSACYVTSTYSDYYEVSSHSDVIEDSAELAAIENSYLWGKWEREYLEKKASGETGDPAIIGAHFTVDSDYLKKTIQVQSFIDADPEVAESNAKKILVKKYSLYYQAQEAGVVVSDEYLDDLIAKNIAMSGESMENSPQYVSFLDGMEMTNEEYWHSCKDNLRITESIAAWEDHIYDEFLKENGYDTDPPKDLGTLWDTYYENLVDEIIAQENIRYVDIG